MPGAARSETMKHPSPMRRFVTRNRNLILFVAMLSIVLMLPLFEDTPVGEKILTVATMLLVLIAVAVNGRSRLMFYLSLGLALPAVLLRFLAFADGRTGLLIGSWACTAAVLAVTMLRLLMDIFAAGRVTRDKLFGCATVYLLIGLLWCFLFTILEELQPGSISGIGTSHTVRIADLAYFSFNVATNVALTSSLPVTRPAQVLVLLQEYTSILYMAFVISRLVGLRSEDAEPGDEEG